MKRKHFDLDVIKTVSSISLNSGVKIFKFKFEYREYKPSKIVRIAIK